MSMRWVGSISSFTHNSGFVLCLPCVSQPVKRIHWKNNWFYLKISTFFHIQASPSFSRMYDLEVSEVQLLNSDKNSNIFEIVLYLTNFLGFVIFLLIHFYFTFSLANNRNVPRTENKLKSSEIHKNVKMFLCS